jgi:hypothetical protein
MSTAASTISITAKFSLPSLATVLKLPTSVGGVSVSTLSSVLMKGSNDLKKLILDLEHHEWRDAAELFADDGLYAAGEFGVPGATVAATIAPYVFDAVNAEIDGHGKPTVQQFVTELVYSQTNLDQIVVDIGKHDWSEVTELTLDDLLDVASAFGAGPAATLTKAAVNIAFAIAKSGGEPAAFNALFAGVDQFVKDAKSLPGQFVTAVEDLFTGGAQPIAGYPGWYFSPAKGAFQLKS